MYQTCNNIITQDLEVVNSKNDEFNEYLNIFVQRLPKYAIKSKKKWITKKKPLSDIPVLTHLEAGKYAVGSLGKWYPQYSVIDIDDAKRDRVEKIREEIGLNVENSILFNSASKDSYHILFKPSYAGKPPTLKLLNEVLKPFVLKNQIELYPQSNKVVRLPFGLTSSKPADYEYRNLQDWQEKLYWFGKLDDFDLSSIPYYKEQKEPKMLEYPDKQNISSNTYQEGKFLYQNGLLSPNSRHDSEWKVIYYLFRQNIPQDTAISMTFDWLRKKHNNYSKDILTAPLKVKKEIERQAEWIYTHYQAVGYYPDSINNAFYGYIAKPDIERIIKITKGNIPKSKFLFNLIKYCYPRRHRDKIAIHSDKLRLWSKNHNIKYLDELKKQGIIKRIDSYQINVRSKEIKIDWKFKDTNQAILIDGRAPDSLNDTIKASFEIDEFKALLKKVGLDRKRAFDTIKGIFY